MQSDSSDYERILLVKPEVFMYRIPPRTSNRAYRASEWKLDAPDWSGRMRIVSLGVQCIIKLEDKTSGELFAACPVDSYPSVAVESVSDSARYFVIRIKDESGRTAFIGIGFTDRSDSFDFNVALQDHFKYLKKDEEMAKGAPIENEKKLDLSFKEGQTIKINIGKKSETSSSSIPRQKPRTSGGGVGGILLPPPPGSKSTPSQQQSQPSLFQAAPQLQQPQQQQKPASFQSASSNADALLLDFDSPAPAPLIHPSAPFNSNQASNSNLNNNSNNNNWDLFM